MFIAVFVPASIFLKNVERVWKKKPQQGVIYRLKFLCVENSASFPVGFRVILFLPFDKEGGYCARVLKICTKTG